jgi:hypothetical protein
MKALAEKLATPRLLLAAVLTLQPGLKSGTATAAG